MGDGGIAPASSPSPVAGRPANSRASSAVAAASVVLILLYVFWRFVWHSKKHASTNSSTAPRPEAGGASVDAERGESGRRTPLPTSVQVATPKAGGAEEKAECAVCLVEFAQGEAGRLVPGCGHGFHAACIETWFRVRWTCPLCRAAVQEDRNAGPAPRFERIPRA